MSQFSVAHLRSGREFAQALISRADSLICPDSMERARAWIEAGLHHSLDPYRLMTFRDLIEAFPDGISMVAEIVETADRLQPGWSQGSSGECHIDYLALRLREACEACLAAEAASNEMAAARAKYLNCGSAAAKIDGRLHEAFDDAFTESDHLTTLQGACRNLHNAVRGVSDDPANVGRYVRDIANICQHWRSKVRGAAQYLHRSLPALERLASGDDAAAQEVADMAILEKLMDDYAESRLADPNDPANDPDLAARKSKALQTLVAENGPENRTAEHDHALGYGRHPRSHET